MARIFCCHPNAQRFHNVFISCNEPVNTGTRWCLHCEKCAFVYLVFSAWMSPNKVWGIFGENIFEKKDMSIIFQSLIGIKGNKMIDNFMTKTEVNNNERSRTHGDSKSNNDSIPPRQTTNMKPFECVGTFEECGAAVELAIMQYIKYAIQIQYEKYCASRCGGFANRAAVLTKDEEEVNGGNGVGSDNSSRFKSLVHYMACNRDKQITVRYPYVIRELSDCLQLVLADCITIGEYESKIDNEDYVKHIIEKWLRK